MATLVFIGVGANLGDPHRTLTEAQKLLATQPDVRFLRSAPMYETEPVGGPAGQKRYLNTVWEIETGFSARNLLDCLLEIEIHFGRTRVEINDPRTLDLDLLFYGDAVMDEPGLTVPHPRLQDRWFVLKPLWDLRADFIHPVLGKSVCELLDEVSGSSQKS